jgi:hypothetical protein
VGVKNGGFRLTPSLSGRRQLWTFKKDELLFLLAATSTPKFFDVAAEGFD